MLEVLSTLPHPKLLLVVAKVILQLKQTWKDPEAHPLSPIRLLPTCPFSRGVWSAIKQSTEGRWATRDGGSGKSILIGGTSTELAYD